MSFVGPYPIDEVIERVQAKVTLAKLVGGAADLEAVLDSPPDASPAIYITGYERGGELKYFGPMAIQNADVQLQAILLVRSAAKERHGEGAKEKATEVVKQLRQTLIGWTPHEAFTPLSFTASRDDSYRGGWYAVQHVFAAGYRIQTTPMD